MVESKVCALYHITFVSTVVKGQADRSHENLKLECPWIGESIGYKEASTHAENSQSPNHLLYGDN